MEKAGSSTRGKVLLATVKGDVHDIGKNLVDIVLSNNGFTVVNLGIKVPSERLIQAVREHQPDVIGLSGLLVKSAQQMVLTAADLAAVGISLPLLVGGAALTRRFTHRKIAPAYGALCTYAKDAMHGLKLVERLLDGAARPELRSWAGIVGAVMLLLGATAVFAQLQEALNAVWEVKPRPGRLVRDFLKKRLLSFGLVLAIGFLLLVSLVLSAGLTAFGAYVQRRLAMSTAVLDAANFALFFVVIGVLFALIFRLLPDAVIAWRDVAVGAVITALMFSLGKYLIGLYLGRSGVASVYGVAGSLVLLLLWVYYSSMIMLMGAGFTRVWSRRYRPRGVVPEPGAKRAPAAPG
jgi:membrane protein